MIRAQNHSSYPRVGDSPLDQQVRTARRRFDAGKIDRDALREAIDEATTIAVAEQSRAFIDVVTDGAVAHDGPLSAPLGAVAGLEAGEWVRWYETNFYDRRPVVTGPLAREASWLRHGAEVAAAVALSKTVKAVLLGPATFARLARDEHYGTPDAVADAWAEVLAAEVCDLASAGVRHFQFDEPELCRRPEDLPLAERTLARVVEAAGDDATTTLSTYFGAVSFALAGIPCSHVGLDLCDGGCDPSVLAGLPADKGVALGVFDARSAVQEDAADVASRLEPYRETLQTRDVLVGPNAGVELLSRDQAFDKLLHARYLVEHLQKEWSWD